MYKLSPTFWDKFVCTGDTCRLTCCGGWVIKLSEEEKKKYIAASEGILPASDESFDVTEDGNYIIKMDGRRMCPWCDENTHYCNLVCKEGPGVLSHTCAEFPRLFTVSPTMDERYLSLGCPRAVELLLEDMDILMFDLSEDDKPMPQYSPEAERVLLADMRIRDNLLDIMQDRRFGIEARLFYAFYMLEHIKEMHHKSDVDGLNSALDVLMDEKVYSNFLNSLKANEESGGFQFAVIPGLLEGVHERCDRIRFTDSFGSFEYLDRLFALNKECDYEKWLWAKNILINSELYSVFMEKTATYNWMLTALSSTSFDYLSNNYLIIILGLIFIKQLLIMSIIDKGGELIFNDLCVCTAVINRISVHCKRYFEVVVTEMRDKGYFSVNSLFMLLY